MINRFTEESVEETVTVLAVENSVGVKLLLSMKFAVLRRRRKQNSTETLP